MKGNFDKSPSPRRAEVPKQPTQGESTPKSVKNHRESSHGAPQGGSAERAKAKNAIERNSR